MVSWQDDDCLPTPKTKAGRPRKNPIQPLEDASKAVPPPAAPKLAQATSATAADCTEVAAAPKPVRATSATDAVAPIVIPVAQVVTEPGPCPGANRAKHLVQEKSQGYCTCDFLSS